MFKISKLFVQKLLITLLPLLVILGFALAVSGGSLSFSSGSLGQGHEGGGCSKPYP